MSFEECLVDGVCVQIRKIAHFLFVFSESRQVCNIGLNETNAF